MDFENGIVTFLVPMPGIAETIQSSYKGKFFTARAENQDGTAIIKVTIEGKKPIFLQKVIEEKKVAIDLDALLNWEPYVLIRGEKWEGFYVEGKLVAEGGILTAETFQAHIPGFRASWLSEYGEKQLGSKFPANLRDMEDFI